MRKYRKISLWVFLILASLLVIEVSCTQNPTAPGDSPIDTIIKSTPSADKFHFPIDKGLDRVTKKTFWLQVSPKNSPVSPEKFSGYHTGTDFETFDTEKDTAISIKAICTGPLLLKKWATGYGGVAVQKCELDKELVTVVYGHLKLESIVANINAELKTGDMIGVLGKWYSSETNGERKHLHLSIHKWSGVNIRGYVATNGELVQWFDPMKYLQ